MGKQEEWLPLLEGLPNMTLDEAEGRLKFLVGLRLRIQTPQVFIHENGRPCAFLIKNEPVSVISTSTEPEEYMS
jgi:hypothetical protein